MLGCICCTDLWSVEITTIIMAKKGNVHLAIKLELSRQQKSCGPVLQQFRSILNVTSSPTVNVLKAEHFASAHCLAGFVRLRLCQRVFDRIRVARYSACLKMCILTYLVLSTVMHLKGRVVSNKTRFLTYKQTLSSYMVESLL